MNTTAILEWRGKEYSLRYSFKLMQRLKAVGINFARLYRLATANGGADMQDYADEVAMTVAHCLREAGADDATDEAFWEACMTETEYLTEVIRFFMWMGEQYYHASPDAPKQKPQPAAKSRKKSR